MFWVNDSTTGTHAFGDRGQAVTGFLEHFLTDNNDLYIQAILDPVVSAREVCPARF